MAKVTYWVFPNRQTEYRKRTGSFFDPQDFWELNPKSKVATSYDAENPVVIPLSKLDVQAIVKVTEGPGFMKAVIANEDFGFPRGNLQPLSITWEGEGQETFAVAVSLIGAWEASWLSTGS